MLHARPGGQAEERRELGFVRHKLQEARYLVPLHDQKLVLRHPVANQMGGMRGGGEPRGREGLVVHNVYPRVLADWAATPGRAKGQHRLPSEGDVEERVELPQEANLTSAVGRERREGLREGKGRCETGGQRLQLGWSSAKVPG